MAVKIETIYHMIDEMAPFSEAYSWDNSGWLVKMGDETQNIMIALDLTDAVIDRAIEKECGLIITHHPILFESIKKIDPRSAEQKRMVRLIQNNISLISAHTNMDKAKGGINDYLAGKLKLINTRVLTEENEGYVKIAVFVPLAYTQNVSDAACRAGAGYLGNYSYCTFQSEGIGTFLPNGEAHPFTGKPGELHREKEAKLEMICPESLLGKVTEAIKKSHPYEMPAMDIYSIREPKGCKGTARIGYLEKEYGKKEFIEYVKTKLGFETVRVSSFGRQNIRCIAVCGGGGGSLLNLARINGADAYLTGELKHSDYIGCAQDDMLLMEAGHFDTEECFTGIVFEGLQQRLNALKCNVHVMGANEARPFIYV